MVRPFKKTKQTILFWTYFFSERYWGIFPKDYDYTKCDCDLSNTTVSYDYDLITVSDIVMFHGRNMPTINQLEILNKRRPPWQLWLFFTMESPRNTPLASPFDKFFNLSTSHRRTSDFRFPQKEHFPVSQPIVNKNKINYAAGKTKQIAWMVNNCGMLREQLAHKLESYGIQIAVGGSCKNKFKNKMTCQNYACKEELKKYKFYFAAENTFCTDYVTEKYWYKPIDFQMVPIVLGGSNYSIPELVIPGSYINAFDFKSVKELAAYIEEVEKNDTKYNQYFKWKPFWRIPDPLQRACTYMCKLSKFIERYRAGYDFIRHPVSYSVNRSECNPVELYFKEWIKN